MNVIITGASGFVGNNLAKYLCAHPGALSKPISTLILADLLGNRTVQNFETHSNVEWRCGDLTDAAYLDWLLDEPVDYLFHLASVPGALAERKPELGWSVNLMAPLALADKLARQGRERGQVARIVFASTVAVYGPLGPGPVNEDQHPRPVISYGAHKLMTEILLADLSRRGEIDARSLRLPGIVARPLSESGHGSAFMSLLFHKAASGEPYVCPVSPEATAWWMSLNTCVANLVQAAKLDSSKLWASRVWQLPALHARVDEIVAALKDYLGPDSTSRICFDPDASIERLFGQLPALSTPRSEFAGFIRDEDPNALVASVLGSGLLPASNKGLSHAGSKQ